MQSEHTSKPHHIPPSHPYYIKEIAKIRHKKRQRKQQKKKQMGRVEGS
jgi:hypothetical protein